MARVMTGFRSAPSRKPVFLQMENVTNSVVNLIWLDYYGRETNYGSLDPYSQKSVHSYEGHPWLCRENLTRRKYLMNKKELYVNNAVPPHNGNVKENVPIIHVIISYPALSLQEICVDTIIIYLHSEDNVKALRMPKKLNDCILKGWRHANPEND